MGVRASKKAGQEERNMVRVRARTEAHMDGIRRVANVEPRAQPLTLQEYFLGRSYKEGQPCDLEGYSEEFLPLSASVLRHEAIGTKPLEQHAEAAVLRHEATGIRIWQFAVDLRVRNQEAVIREIFQLRDADGSGLLSRSELKDALQALGYHATHAELCQIILSHAKYGGFRGARINCEDFVKVVERMYADQVCLFVYTDEQGFRSVVSPGQQLSHIWIALAGEENSELGPGLHASSKSPDQWQSQSELIINNRWPNEHTAEKWMGDVATSPRAAENAELCEHILRNAAEGAVAFCIPVLCGRKAASDLRNYIGEGQNVWGDELQPWRDLWVIDLAWGGVNSHQDQMSLGVSGFLSGSPIVDSLASCVSARIKWRDAQFGYDDPHTASFLEYLATLRLSRGRLDLAGPLLRRAFGARQQSSGWEDAATLATGTNLGLLLERCGEADEAEHLLRYVAAIRTKRLGESHPDTLSSICNLAFLLRKRGEREEAKRWVHHCLRVCKVVVKERRADANACLSSAAVLLIKGGQREAHDQLMSQVLLTELERLRATEQEKQRMMSNTEDVAVAQHSKGKHGRKALGQQRSQLARSCRRRPRRAGQPSQHGPGRSQAPSDDKEINVTTPHEDAEAAADLKYITRGVELLTLSNAPRLPLERM